MKYLTITEYAKHFGTNRQTVYNRIKARKLVYAPVSITENRILVEDTEYEKVKTKREGNV